MSILIRLAVYAKAEYERQDDRAYYRAPRGENGIDREDYPALQQYTDGSGHPHPPRSKATVREEIEEKEDGNLSQGVDRRDNQVPDIASFSQVVYGAGKGRPTERYQCERDECRHAVIGAAPEDAEPYDNESCGE